MIRAALMTATTALALSFPAFAQSEYDASTVLATVNGEEINLGQVIALLERVPQFQDRPDEELYTGILDQLITQTLIAQSESKSPETDTLRMRLTMKNERTGRLAQDAIERVANSAVGDAELQAAYDAQFASFEPEIEYNASHILVETEEEALAIVDEINGGADFAETAKTKSTGPSGPRGGDLGWFGAGRMIPAFESAMLELEAGEISGPVQTEFGWHVIKFGGERETAPPPLEAVRDQLAEPIRRAAVDAFVQSMRDAEGVVRAEVDIPFTAIRETDLIAGE